MLQGIDLSLHMKSFLRKYFEKLIASFGCSLVGTTHLAELVRMAAEARAAVSMETHLVRLLQLHKPDCIFDVGAHDGGFGRMIRSLGYKGWIVSFEPMRGPALALRRSAEVDEKWMVEEYALGAVVGKAEFHQMAGDVFSSFLLPDENQPAKYRDSNTVVSSIIVPVKTVDAVWSELKERLSVSRLMLKMDTQGFDLDVFAGAAASLADIGILMSEMSCISIYAGAPSLQESLTAFAAAGFRPAFMAPISFTSQLEAIELDGVFVRPSSSHGP